MLLSCDRRRAIAVKCRLLDADHHAHRSNELFGARGLEACLMHPLLDATVERMVASFPGVRLSHFLAHPTFAPFRTTSRQPDYRCSRACRSCSSPSLITRTNLAAPVLRQPPDADGTSPPALAPLPVAL